MCVGATLCPQHGMRTSVLIPFFGRALGEGTLVSNALRVNGNHQIRRTAAATLQTMSVVGEPHCSHAAVTPPIPPSFVSHKIGSDSTNLSETIPREQAGAIPERLSTEDRNTQAGTAVQTSLERTIYIRNGSAARSSTQDMTTVATRDDAHTPAEARAIAAQASLEARQGLLALETELVSELADTADSFTRENRFTERQARKAWNTVRKEIAALSDFMAFLATTGVELSFHLAEEPRLWSAITFGLVESSLLWERGQGYAIKTLNDHLTLPPWRRALRARHHNRAIHHRNTRKPWDGGTPGGLASWIRQERPARLALSLSRISRALRRRQAASEGRTEYDQSDSPMCPTRYAYRANPEPFQKDIRREKICHSPPFLLLFPLASSFFSRPRHLLSLQSRLCWRGET